MLSQIELRSSNAPTSLRQKQKQSELEAINRATKKATRYVEGESSDDDVVAEADNAGAMDIEVESGDESGSVEDVELGGDSSEARETDEGSDEDEEEDDEEDDGDESGGKTARLANGFVDDEAEEDWGEDESEEEEE